MRPTLIMSAYEDMPAPASRRAVARFIASLDFLTTTRLVGRQLVLLNLDASILEYKDVFRIQPAMPTTGNLDPKTLQKTFERENGTHVQGARLGARGSDLGLFLQAFLSEHPTAITRTMPISGKVHRDLTRDGKARLHQFVKKHAMRDDLFCVIDLVKALRFYMCLPTSG